jgi:uncharacterized damage-inducible protein DinB
MNSILRDLLEHQFWADAEQWRAIAAHPPATADRALCGRLHHIHQVQRFFIWAVSHRANQPVITSADQYPTFSDLQAYARESHQTARAFLSTIGDSDFDRAVTIPWFNDPPLTISVTEALTQMAMHSHHHRGQNLTRLRELGGEPPALDLIVWYWKQRPAAAW